MKIIVITSPTPVKDEAAICNHLFTHGLKYLHLRKPGASAEVYERFIRQIFPVYRNRIVLHEHYELVKKYRLHGIHLKYPQANEYIYYIQQYAVSISCHRVDEIRQLPFRPAYCFLSPIFDSISKTGYRSRFGQLPDLSDIDCPVIALGGLEPDKTGLCRRAGFEGIAVLGYLWNNPDEAIERYIRLKTPFVLSIAGFDPSSGAGIGADLKTFEATGSYGLGVCSALTFQNEDTFTGVHWTAWEDIKKQCDLLLQKYNIEFLKIGLIESFEILDRLLDYLLDQDKRLKIIWDPILKASAGFSFHRYTPEDQERLKRILDRVYLITPNTDELYRLFGEGITPDRLQIVCRDHHLNILWKGGHNAGVDATDVLFQPDRTTNFSVPRSRYTKHGTGCTLSSALLSALAQGDALATSCNKAQLYVSRFIESNNSLLGYHCIGKYTPDSKPWLGELSLQYITAPKEGMTLCEQVEAVCQGGMRWIQLRMKGASLAEMLCEGRKVKEICRRHRALFIINDRVDVARLLEADGVHLGKEDMDPWEARRILGPGKIVGATCNTWDDILLRQKQQVDYIGLGPYAFTTTKEKLSPVLGLEGYRFLLGRIQENKTSIPVFAIGGITETDIPPLMQTGIQGIALSGLIKNSPDLKRQTIKILNLLNS